MEEKNKENKGRTKCNVFTRVCGYLRPTSSFNEGKAAEYKDRKTFTANINNANNTHQLKPILDSKDEDILIDGDCSFGMGARIPPTSSLYRDKVGENTHNVTKGELC